jgi:7,8-dihydroneopterin aldolase/epimerase/oxygenase
MANDRQMPGGPADALAALRLQQARRVFIRNFRTPLSVGVHDHEKQARQMVVVGVELYLDPQARIQRDSIRETVDYDVVRTEILSLADSGHFHLVETFCERVLAICLDKPGVVGARVSCEKPDIYPDCDAVGFEILGVK